ncbi:hypothetical protein UFOVP49_130 [uncultured Caudovirales phage]|uniref:Uncharacterized protein n=1 Tax=uncultured Caudovirales phage TaxID=2100421 RepID=A0A6J5KSQ5_9CAUD|nr:hypothetical protein UFOVP49_130 [uncultured Caudovirales phage]
MSDTPSDIDLLNSQFDSVLAGKFANGHLVIQTIRAILEKFGLQLPIIEVTGEDDVFVFEINDNPDLYLYIAIDKDNRGHFDVYAQIVDEDELEELDDLDVSSDELEDEDLSSTYLRQTRRTADD